MTRKERIEYLAKAVMTLSELGDNKTAYVLNEIRLELKQQPSLLPDVDEAAKEEYPDTGEASVDFKLIQRREDFKAGVEIEILTWEDMQRVWQIFGMMRDECKKGEPEWMFDRKSYFSEALKRFRKIKPDRLWK